MKRNYLLARDELVERLVGSVQGVASVGLGKRDGEIVLVVATNGEFKPESQVDIQKNVDGIAVVFQEFGQVEKGD